MTVTGLNPDHLYNVRVIAANSHNFQAPGQLIRLRTRRKSASSTDAGASNVNGKADSSEDIPSVQPSLEPSSPHTHNHHHHHHHSNGSNQLSRRAARERRSSPAVELQNQQAQNASSFPAEDQHSVESLTAALEIVRRDIDDTEAQLLHTEEEFRAAELVLRIELDLLKERKNEEDSSRQKLRSETRTLEEAKRAAEALRTKTDKGLRSKEDEIQKMRDDSLRWDEERVAALEKVEELTQEARESKEHAQSTERDLSEEMKETQRSIAEMEEEIRALVGSIKASEAQKEQWKAEEEAENARIAEDEKEEREWRIRQRKLETRYVNVYNSYQAVGFPTQHRNANDRDIVLTVIQTELDYIRSKELLMNSHSRRGSHGDIIPPKKTKQRRHRNRKSRTHTVSNSTHAFPPADPIFPDASARNSLHLPRQLGSAFSNSMIGSPFFNIANDAAPTETPDSIDPMSVSLELERLSGNGPMSPTANSLLPSNLFAFEDSPPSPRGNSPILSEGQLRASPVDLLGLGLIPQSPQSSNSASTHLSSPGSSFHHIPLFHDTQPTPADDPPSGGRRFVRLFSNSFVRQRGKAIPLEGPLLGSLRSDETHSVPKPPDSPSLDPIGTRRRSGSHGSWTTNLDFLHAGRSKKGGGGLERTTSESSRRSAFNPFNPSFDPIEPTHLFEGPDSPRPSSITSFDNALPIPSNDVGAAFGWPVSEGMDRPRNRVSLLGTSWSDFRVGGASRPVSRPTSPLHGNSSSVSLSLAPSGGGGDSGAQGGWFIPAPVTPRLNPAAPTFETRSGGANRGKDSLSINTDTSSITGSIETGPSNSGILSRFSALSRKGSTTKLNLPGWKKDGVGFFGRKAKDSDADEGEAQHQEQGNFIQGSSPMMWKDKGSGFFGRNGKGKEEEEEEEREKEKDGWGRGGLSQSGGFFGTIGRKEKEREDGEQVRKEGLQGIFGRKKGREEKEKREIGESEGEGA